MLKTSTVEDGSLVNIHSDWITAYSDMHSMRVRIMTASPQENNFPSTEANLHPQASLTRKTIISHTN